MNDHKKTFPTRPTRVVQELREVIKSRMRVLFLCDDGNTYTADQLAAMVGIRPAAFFARVYRYGVESELLLKPKAADGKYLSGAHYKQLEKAGKQRPRRSNSAFATLSSRERRDKLAALPKPGSLERKYLGNR